MPRRTRLSAKTSVATRCRIRAGDKAKRLAKIQEAMAALEADAKLAAEEERRIEAEKESSATLKAARSRQTGGPAIGRT